MSSGWPALMWERPLRLALRKAQRLLRQNPRYRDPYSWAGFVLQGDWR
jgi:CHAT domain-containing protein